MTPTEFANRIRTRYPNGITSDGLSYAELDDRELTRRIIEKHPVYKSQIKGLDEAPQKSGPIGSPFAAVGEFVTGVKNAIAKRGDAAATEQERASEGQISPGRAVLRTAGQAVAGVGDVGVELLKLVAPKFLEDMAASGVEKIGETELVQSVARKYDELRQKHPEAVKDVEALFNIGSLLPVGKAAQLATKGAVGATAKVGKAAATVAGDALEARRVARVAATKQDVDRTIGTIVQGKTGDIETAKRALASIDTADVKTYADLRERIDENVGALAERLDSFLDAQDSRLPRLKEREVETTTRVGSQTVSQNFVVDALDQLDELYRTVKDTPARARIAQIRSKFKSEGLSRRELNDLSRMYGREFRDKAFNKANGDPLTTVNAQAYENTRKGIKEAVRSTIQGKVPQLLDERMSDLIETNHLVSNMEERVNKLYQRAKKRGLMERIARRAADVVDVATLHTVSGFISRLLPSNVGLKTMNAIDLEEALRRNLKKVDKLLAKSDDTELEEGIAELLRSGGEL